MSNANAVTWLIAAKERHLDDLLHVALRFVVKHFRVLRDAESEEFARLQGHPELMMCVMQAI